MAYVLAHAALVLLCRRDVRPLAGPGLRTWVSSDTCLSTGAHVNTKTKERQKEEEMVCAHSVCWGGVLLVWLLLVCLWCWHVRRR